MGLVHWDTWRPASTCRATCRARVIKVLTSDSPPPPPLIVIPLLLIDLPSPLFSLLVLPPLPSPSSAVSDSSSFSPPPNHLMQWEDLKDFPVFSNGFTYLFTLFIYFIFATSLSMFPFVMVLLDFLSRILKCFENIVYYYDVTLNFPRAIKRFKGLSILNIPEILLGHKIMAIHISSAYCGQI